MSPLTDYLRRNKLSDSAFAGQIGLSVGGFRKIKRGDRQASPQVALKIDEVTSGEIGKHLLRPDIFEAPRARSEKADQ